ncbi:MAG: helix-turn-helix domain-containing protein [Halobacteriaceae archaeon]
MRHAPAMSLDASRTARADDVVIRDQSTAQAALGTFGDDGCRAILEATTGQARTAAELATACDRPLSTVYRKLDRLDETGLLEERTRIREPGEHASEYVRVVDDVVVSVDGEGGVTVRVNRIDPPERPVAREEDAD